MARKDRQPAQVALALVVLAAAFPVRFGIGSGRTASWFDLACLLVVPVALIGAAGRRGASARGIVGPALLVTVISGLSVGWSSEKTGTILHTISWIEAALVAAFCASRVGTNLRPERVIAWTQRLVLLLLAGAVALELHVPGFGVPANVDRLSGDYASFYARLSHPFLGRSNNLATLLAVFVLPLAWWAVQYGRRRDRAVTLLTAAAIVATLSRGVLLGVLIAAVLAAPSSRRQARRLGRFLLGAAFLGVAAFAVLVFSVDSFRTYLGSRLSWSNVADRADLLNLGSRQIYAHPLAGIGGGAGDNIHDTFLQQVVYYGIGLGLVAAWAIAIVPRWFFRRGTPIATICGWSVVGVWLSCLVESSLEGTLLLPEVFLAVGLLAALCLAWERHGPPAASYARAPRKRRSVRPSGQRRAGQRETRPGPARRPGRGSVTGVAGGVRAHWPTNFSFVIRSFPMNT